MSEAGKQQEQQQPAAAAAAAAAPAVASDAPAAAPAAAAAASGDDGKAVASAKGPPYFGPILRQTVVHTSTYGHGVTSAVLKEFDGCTKVDGASLLEGFPSISLTSIITATFLVDALDLPLIGVLNSPAFPSRCVIDKGQPSYPVRIYGNAKVVVWVSEFRVPNELTNVLVEALFDFCVRHKLRRLITVEGLPSDDAPDPMRKPASERRKRVTANGDSSSGAPPGSDAEIYFLSTNDESNKRLMELGCKPVPQGIIDGITGAVLSESIFRSEVDVLTLLTPATVRVPDAWPAVNIVKLLGRFMPELTFDIKPLEAKALETEGMIKSALANINMGGRGQLPPPTMYG